MYIEEQYKQILIKQNTFQRLKHTKKHFPDDVDIDVDSYDGIISELIRFYEEFDRNRRF